MKVKREKLLCALETVSPGLSAKEIVEQSGCFVFRGGQVITFNDETAYSAKCKVGFEGAVLSAPLLALLRKLSEDDLEVTATEGEIRIRGQRREAGVRLEQEITLPVEGIEEATEWKPLPEGLLDAVNVVQSCASADESQFVLTCVHIHPEWVEACDNFQLARYPLDTGLSKPTLIRRTSLKGVVGMEFSEFSETDNWLHFRKADGLTVSCRRYMEQYPSLDGFLKAGGVVVAMPKGLDVAVAKAQVFCEDKDAARVTVELRSRKARVSGMGANGWFRETLTAEYDGEELQFVIDPRLLLEIIRRAEKIEVQPGKLSVSGGRFSYVTCTAKVEKKEGKEE